MALLIALASPQVVGAQQSMPATGAMSPEQVQAVEKIVHDYLLRNPQVILDAVEQLEQKRNDEAQAAAKTAMAEHRDELLHDPTSPVAGNPNGDVTIVEFFDYRCPYCKQVEPSLAQLRKDDQKLRFVYKEFPILGPDSVIASHAALAARKQDKYQPFHDALMAARGHLDEATIFAIAADTGLDVQRLKADMKSPDIEAVISRNMALAHVLNINGTPGFIVGDQLVPGAVELADLKKLVAEARK
ncbi:MAG TPA: DsbA family protein [Alphaproteobacteria bacterium]|nr:DsbA family protein [Alphaproteobacteria bacterium]